MDPSLKNPKPSVKFQPFRIGNSLRNGLGKIYRLGESAKILELIICFPAWGRGEIIGTDIGGGENAGGSRRVPEVQEKHAILNFNKKTAGGQHRKCFCPGWLEPFTKGNFFLPSCR